MRDLAAAMMGSGRLRTWGVLAAVLLVVGSAAATVGADRVLDQDVQTSRQQFQRSSAEVASTLQLAIEHQNDLVVNASGFVVANPDASEADFRAWAASVHVLDRYPEVLGFGFVAIVPAPELPDFVTRVLADPPTVLAAGGSVQIQPPGKRLYYCLTKLGQIRSLAVGTPAGLDWCATPGIGPAGLRARDSGSGAYSPITLNQTHLLSVNVPVYTRGVTPTSTAARREAILGWVATVSTPTILLDRALQGHPGTAVILRYHDATSDAAFSSGKAPAGAQSVALNLQAGWTVQTSGGPASRQIWDDGKALALLIFGVLSSLLLGALVLVLATGRARALRLVEVRTAQLRGTQAELVDTARRAGMAEIAVNVLHNVGNVLNSVNVSADLVGQKVRGSKSAGLRKAVDLLHAHADDLGDFLTIDPRGKKLPGYLDALASALASERTSLDEELLRLTKGVDHIKEIVNAQQSLAKPSDVMEPVEVNDLLEDGLRMAGVLGLDEISVTRDYPDAGTILLDRHRVLLVLLNLIGNANHAMTRNAGHPGQLSLRGELVDGRALHITVTDNGVGIPPENLTQIFQHGFTTHAEGHGFGLHSSALAAKEMGGALTVHSDGTGTGATFTLEVPLRLEAAVA